MALFTLVSVTRLYFNMAWRYYVNPNKNENEKKKTKANKTKKELYDTDTTTRCNTLPVRTALCCPVTLGFQEAMPSSQRGILLRPLRHLRQCPPLPHPFRDRNLRLRSRAAPSSHSSPSSSLVLLSSQVRLWEPTSTSNHHEREWG